MKINFVNPINTNQPQKTIRKSPNFTSVIPVKVFVGGEKSVDLKIIRKVILELTKMIQNVKDSDAKTLAFRHFFSTYDPDFQMSVPIRKKICSTISYLFTGPQSKQLEILGKKIGPAKRNSMKIFGTTHNAEVKLASDEYFEKKTFFIDSVPDAKVKVDGHEVGLHIYATSTKIPKKNQPVVIIDKININKIVGNSEYAKAPDSSTAKKQYALDFK